ncbi:MAG: hypothetical protein ACNA8L_11360 [Luteolibacter sp.]
MNRNFPCLHVLAFALALVATAAAEVRVDLSSRFLARGEQALLEITTIGDAPDRELAIPRIHGIEIRPAGMGIRPRILPGPGRIRAYTAQYTLHSYDVGVHAIPAFDVAIAGQRFTTRPLDFEIFNPDDLHWNEVLSGGRPMRYATTIRTLKPNAYEGESVPVEIKIYIPQSLRVEDWGIPEFQVDGVAAWRFEPSRMRSQVNLLGQPYTALAYPSTMSATRSGEVRVGPASVRLTTVQVVMDRIARQAYEQINLQIPAKTLDAIPLPTGAPTGFDNAVGDFDIHISTSETEVREGDPVAVDIRVTGSGNLDVLRAPRPVDDDGWRVYEATAVERGTERTEITGEASFRQFLRPLELKSAIPSYRLVFFNPVTESYETVVSDPIALTLLPGASGVFQSSAPPPALSTPVERMADILAITRPATLTIPPAAPFSPWWIHGTGAIAAFILMLRALWTRFSHLLRRDPTLTARQHALREMQSQLPADEAGFLRATGTYIESWLPKHTHDPELTALLAERDGVCFRKEKPATTLDAKRRARVIAALRRAASTAAIALAIGLFTSSPRATADEAPAAPVDIAQAAIEAYESARFDEAARLWLSAGPYESLSADTLYNIGNASYRLGSPGHAALFYRRALTRDATHAEARQNLRFIERKFGAVTIHRPNYQYALGRTPITLWQNLVAACIWGFAISLLVFPATRAGSTVRVPAIIGLVLAPLVAVCAGLAWRYYPDDAEFAVTERQAVVITAETQIHTEASRTAPEVIDAPPGSLLEVLHIRGEWAYVAFATGTRGWIPLETIETIIPDGAPEPPALRKPRATGRSA